MRKQAHAFGAPLSVSEMVASQELLKARPDVLRRTMGGPECGPRVIQLAGRDPEWIARGAQLACELGADVIDLNFGCPAKMVTSGQSGAALMRDPTLARAILRAAVQASSRPVTLKMRLGWCEDSRNAPDIARIAEDEGIALLTVHGRTRAQFYTGKANWTAIAQVRAATRLPLIANGDITSLADARQAMAASGADGVMVGRAMQGHVWFAGALARALSTGAGGIEAPACAQVFASLQTQFEDALECYGPAQGVRIMRKHIGWTLQAQWADAPDDILQARRRALLTMDDHERVREALHDLARHPLPPIRSAA